MRRYLLVGMASTMVSPALADGEVLVITQADKDMIVLENIDVAKFVFADAFVSIDAEKFAESYSLVNQTNFSNAACSNCAEKADFIDGSFNTNSGQMSVNQASGNMNNQGSATSIAYDVSPGVIPPPPPPHLGARTPGGFAESSSSVDQQNGVPIVISGNDTGAGGIDTPSGTVTPGIELVPGQLSFDDVVGLFESGFDLENTSSIAFAEGFINDDTATTTLPTSNVVRSENIIFRNAIADDSFSDNSGIIHGNQSAGNMNNQGNSLSLALSLDETGVALSEADLGQLNIANDVFESDGGDDFAPDEQPGANKFARIGGENGSFNGNSGIIGFNQTTGNMGNQANVVSFSSVGVPALN
jgi:hypothetical protein